MSNWFNGNISSTQLPIGKYFEIVLKTGGGYKDPIDFNYEERDGFNETIVQERGGSIQNSSNASIETFANLPFKAQDKIILDNGSIFKITDIVIEPDTNPYRTQFKDRRKFQKKIIFSE